MDLVDTISLRLETFSIVRLHVKGIQNMTCEKSFKAHSSHEKVAGSST